MEATPTRGRLTQDPERIFRKRNEAGLQQKELAARAGITPSRMSRIESGQFAAAPDVLHRLAEALGCPVTDLMPPIAA
jgi:transcriptional regulator with XRE-family HTH domain